MSDCPVCHRPMSSATVGAVAVQNCDRCGGNWIQSDAFTAVTGLKPTEGRHLTCPSCGARLQSRIVRNRELDVCASCGGIWTDAGELKGLTGKDPERAVPLQDFRVFKQCPVCRIPMRIAALDGVEIELCAKCRGAWLDSGEMDRLGGFAMERGRRLFCPACGVLMTLAVHRDVELDVCPGCESAWLDKGELETLSGYDVVHTVRMEERVQAPAGAFEETSVLDALVGNNAHFLQAKKTSGLPPSARLRLVVVTCMDPRLAGLVEEALGLGPGDAYFIKTAGPSASGEGADIMRSAAVAALLGGARELLVLGHTDCQMTKLSTGKVAEAMAAAGLSEEAVRPSALGDWMGGFISERENVLNLVKLLRKSELMPEDVLVHGAVIDTTTGKLLVVSDAMKKKRLMQGAS